MASSPPIRLRSISEFHRMRGLPAPEHPLVSVQDVSAFFYAEETKNVKVVMDFYAISLKRNCGKIRYGHQQYDFDEGVMYFIAPGQVFSVEHGEGEPKQTGWMLLIHPDFLWNTPLAKNIRRYGYFDYAVNEALFLSEREEATLVALLQHIRQEYQSGIDKFSQDIIISQIETLLHYAERFYQRQFITRKITNHRILEQLEALLAAWFGNEGLAARGLPTVQYVADSLAVSPGYLSGLLKVLTGQSTQQHIHDKLIEKAKEKLSTSDVSVSEVAYALGFEHPQSFSKLFRAKTRLSPLEFRQSFG